MHRMRAYVLMAHSFGLFVMLAAASVAGLSCWHCIADNCEENPQDNYKASKRQCLEGQHCQKVTFEMQSDVDSTTYSSVVRSCAESCVDQDDFQHNCSEWRLTTRGCLKRTCCNNMDLCNGADVISAAQWRLAATAALVLVLTSANFSS